MERKDCYCIEMRGAMYNQGPKETTGRSGTKRFSARNHVDYEIPT